MHTVYSNQRDTVKDCAVDEGTVALAVVNPTPKDFIMLAIKLSGIMFVRLSLRWPQGSWVVLEDAGGGRYKQQRDSVVPKGAEL